MSPRDGRAHTSRTCRCLTSPSVCSSAKSRSPELYRRPAIFGCPMPIQARVISRPANLRCFQCRFQAFGEGLRRSPPPAEVARVWGMAKSGCFEKLRHCTVVTVGFRHWVSSCHVSFDETSNGRPPVSDPDTWHSGDTWHRPPAEPGSPVIWNSCSFMGSPSTLLRLPSGPQ